MHPSRLHTTYYAVKDGREGNSICTSWDDVRVALTESTELAPTDSQLTITVVPGSGEAQA